MDSQVINLSLYYCTLRRPGGTDKGICFEIIGQTRTTAAASKFADHECK